jgi:ribosomal-protein-alanine N-acetyltransferase
VLIRSPRLYLRQATLGDASDFFLMDQDPEVMRHIGDGRVTTDPELTRAGLGRVIAAYARRPELGLWTCCLLDGHGCVGWFVLKPCLLAFPAPASEPAPSEPARAVPAREYVELGYRLKREAWGQGYATEMAIELLDYGFTRLGLGEIIAACTLANVASARVMQKAGLRRRGLGIYNTTPVEVYGASGAEWMRPADGGSGPSSV